MNKDGRIHKVISKSLRRFNIIAPLILLIYGTLIGLNIISSRLTKAIDPSMLITLSIFWLILAIIDAIVLAHVYKSNMVSKNAFTRSKNQESLQRDRVLTIINNLTSAVLSTDTNGVINVYNAASLSLLDTNIDLRGQHIEKILKLTDQENKKINIFKEFKKTNTTTKRDDISYCYDDGEQIRLELTYSPIHSSYDKAKNRSTNDGYIIIMNDITKAKSLEEERDEFISVISHELRTPITITEGVISNAQMMLDNPNATQESLKDSMNMAHEQVLFLANMVNDLSTLSRAERGVGDNAEVIDVKDLAHRLVGKYMPDAVAKSLHLNLDLDPKAGKVFVSKLYLEELLQNFITNSIKYTKEGSVTIQISKIDDDIQFLVKDTGIGISKTDQAKVFNKFYRSEDYRTRETGGTGLGLYVSAKLAKKMNTKVQVTSRLNFGSSFSFKLPEHIEQG